MLGSGTGRCRCTFFFGFQGVEYGEYFILIGCKFGGLEGIDIDSFGEESFAYFGFVESSFLEFGLCQLHGVCGDSLCYAGDGGQQHCAYQEFFKFLHIQLLYG